MDQAIVGSSPKHRIGTGSVSNDVVSQNRHRLKGDIHEGGYLPHQGTNICPVWKTSLPDIVSVENHPTCTTEIRTLAPASSTATTQPQPKPQYLLVCQTVMPRHRHQEKGPAPDRSPVTSARLVRVARFQTPTPRPAAEPRPDHRWSSARPPHHDRSLRPLSPRLSNAQPQG